MDTRYAINADVITHMVNMILAVSLDDLFQFFFSFLRSEAGKIKHPLNNQVKYFRISFIRAKISGGNITACYYPIMHLLKYDTIIWRFDWRCYITLSFLV